MISDKSLMKLSLAMSITGVIALFFITQAVEPLKTSIDDIRDSMAGRDVAVHGTIGSIEMGENIFMTLVNGTKINAVALGKDARNVNKNLTVGMNVTVIGKVSVYKGSLEIIVKKIE